MAATIYQGSFVPFASIGRSIFSFQRDQVRPMDGGHRQDPELASFQRRVAELFHDLSSANGEDFLSIAWVWKLLDAFLICQEEFRIVLFNRKGLLARPPLDRMMADFFDRAVKALDVCTAVRSGIEQVRRWREHLDVVLAAIGQHQRTLGEGQLRRARKALTDLSVLMLNNKDALGRGGAHFRSQSWSVPRSWSAARQLQAMGSNLAAPRTHDLAATDGLANPVFTMSSVLLFVMWGLAAAIPCQDRGLQTHFSVPRSFPWAASVLSLHERILEESKKRERKNSSGLLKEIHQIERCIRCLTELTETIELPLTEEKEMEVRRVVQELARLCNVIKDGLDPLECQVREVFHRIVRNRTEGLNSSSQH